MEVLIIFCKPLIPGTVKTRLAKDIGPEKACAVYQQLCEHTRNVALEWGGKVAVFHHSQPKETQLWEQAHWDQQLQSGSDLGERMYHAFAWAFAQGAQKVCIIGSDLASLQVSDLQEAFQALYEKVVVWGPATDGGYYLLGLQELEPLLFSDLPWSQPALLQRSQQRLPTHQHYCLRTQNDIDTLADLKAHPDWDPKGF